MARVELYTPALLIPITILGLLHGSYTADYILVLKSVVAGSLIGLVSLAAARRLVHDVSGGVSGIISALQAFSASSWSASTPPSLPWRASRAAITLASRVRELKRLSNAWPVYPVLLGTPYLVLVVLSYFTAWQALMAARKFVGNDLGIELKKPLSPELAALLALASLGFGCTVIIRWLDDILERLYCYSLQLEAPAEHLLE